MTAGPAAIGIDVGGTHLRAALVNAEGRILRRLSRPVERERAQFIESVARLARKLGAADAVAIGVGLPGRVDVGSGTVESAGYLDIAGLNVAAQLREATGRPVCIENDCGMALVAEMALGAAAGYRDVVMLTIGTGIGGAMAIDHRLVRGSGFAGQFGHITVHPDGRLCKCGRRGCVETTSSGTALTRHLEEVGKPSGMAPRDLMYAADAGDENAAWVLRNWIGPLRLAIESLIATLDPAIIVLGGGLGAAAHKCLDYVPAARSWFHRPVLPAALGDDAGVIGAGLRAMLLHGTSIIPHGWVA